MKLLEFFLILNFITALALSIDALPIKEAEEEFNDTEVDDNIDNELIKEQSSDQIDDQFSSQHGTGRFLAQKKIKRRRMTCNKFPRICHTKGSPGPHCCKKKCVNVLTDRYNCGACKKRCKYNAICCNGKCVNPSFNRRHCGGCNNRCNNGSICAFGLCNYA